MVGKNDNVYFVSLSHTIENLVKQLRKLVGDLKIVLPCDIMPFQPVLL